MFPASLAGAPADVMVTIWDEGGVSDSISLATELRAGGLRVDLYPEADKLGKQFKYAASRGVPLVAVVGENERERGEVSLKDMTTGEQKTWLRSNAAAVIHDMVKRHR